MTEKKPRTRIVETGVELTSSMEPAEGRAAPDPESPFRILVLGDFTGRESRGVRSPEDIGFDRTPVRVDLDNLDELPGELGAEASVQLVDGGSPLQARIRTLEDFHPDRLLGGMPAFRHLNRTRLELQDPETFERAAQEVRSWANLAGARDSSGEVPAPPEAQQPEETDSEQLMREMVERSSEADSGAAGRAHFDRFVASVVRPHLAAEESPDRDDLIRRTDATIGSWMRAFLHHPHFQELEAAWRGVEFLVRRLESDSAVEVHILDVTRGELAEGLQSVPDLSESGLHRVLVDQTEDGEPWSLVVGLFTFDRALEDVALLGRLAKVAKASGAPFLSASSPWIAGRASEEDEDAGEEALWAALRELPESSSIGLALPRFLLRLPYGEATDPTEEFRFEEMEEAEASGNLAGGLLWGNSALACASLIAEAWERGGWRFRPGAVRDIEGLPLYVSRAGGTAAETICAEAALSDRVVEAILDAGLIPVVASAGRDAIRIARFQSIANPPRPLAAAWARGSE